ncbi:hypothetical protein ACQPZK_19240 [Micromonospora sp. CA-249363]|uniref:hypothetical protein n=1 Tax=Micromonospora sp. CA-249363 TaxID=3239963 RepID=UPI003D8E4B08
MFLTSAPRRALLALRATLLTAPGLTLGSGGIQPSYLFSDYLDDDLNGGQRQEVRDGASRIVHLDVLCDARADT